MSIDWDAFQEAVYDFLERVTIVSKDEGRVRLQIYDAQRYAADEIFDGLRKDIHWFVIGKGRQVGITTLCYLFDMFYAAAIPGVQGAIVFDSADNLKIFRELFKESIASLPPSHRLAIRGGKDNRTYMPFENGNMLQYLVAGTKKGQGSLGRSRGINYAHCSEVSYYGDPEAFENFKNTLSEVFPYRCYLMESTGKGFGLLYDLWEDALADDIAKKTVFVTWWRKRTYSYARGTALYKKYGWAQLSDEEREATEVVLRDYKHKITLEQWAWYRHRADPRARAEGELIDSDDRQEIMTQEHPHFPEQMFRGTGSPFIPSQYIGPAQASAEKALFKAYQFYFGDEVTTTRLEPTRFVNRAQLKVWTEPHPNGTYVVSGDPAGGASEDGNNFCAQVIRCYADKQVQVAEFCDPNITPYQFAWVMLYLCGWYEDCRYILEINSYGEAVMVEMRNLVRLITDGRLFSREEDPGLILPDGSSRPWRGIWNQVRQYLYRRQDSIAGGQFNLHFKCLALTEPLPTPTGWTTMGEVEVGDRLFDEQGKECRVVALSDVKSGQECFRITFDDGTQIVADADHLWPLVDMWPTRTCELRPGIDRVPVASQLDIWPKDLPIDPYVLGAWLGDGHSADGRISIGAQDVDEMRANLERSGMELAPASWNNTVYIQTIYGLKEKLREVGVLGDKHIPDIYLRAGPWQRWALLQGLMDTDGTINANNGRQCMFITTKPRLAQGFAELLRTLGIKAKYLIRHDKLEYQGRMVECAAAYQFWFTAYEQPIFRLRRKLSRQDWPNLGTGYHKGGMKRSKTHKIVAVDPVETVPVRCLQVDSPSRVYLAGRGMIPTHNTTLESKFTYMTQMADRFMLGELQVNSVPCLKEMRTLRKDGREIGAEVKKQDDRPVALALGVRAYIDQERAGLWARNATFAAETERDTQSGDGRDLGVRYMSGIMANHIAAKSRMQRETARRVRRGQRWNW